jgi:hypothetical protein
MFPDGWWIPPLITAIVIIGGGAVALDELIRFVIRHWAFVQHLF